MGDFYADFGDVCNQEITVRLRSGHDQWGKAAAPGVPTTMKARVVFGRRLDLRVDPISRDERTRVTVWTGPTPSLSPEDEVTLPDGTKPLLLTVDKYPDETGVLYYQVLSFA